jgi:hypothetical protein
MTLGLTSSGAVKIKTDEEGGGLRAVECACCNTCPPFFCPSVKITNPSLIALLNSATSGSFNYSQGTDSLPLWTSHGPDSFTALWSCCNHPDGCIHCEDDWDYQCNVGWTGSLRGDCLANVLYIYAYDFPWGYSQIAASGDTCNFQCDPLEESSIQLNGYQLLVTMSFGCPDPDHDFPIYPISINLT